MAFRAAPGSIIGTFIGNIVVAGDGLGLENCVSILKLIGVILELENCFASLPSS